MNENKDEEFWESAENWKAGAIAFAIGTPIVCAFFAKWVYSAQSDLVMLQRFQIVGGVAAFGVALITFCSVIWRGIISTQQAKLQRLQIDKLSAQIAATEISNLAALLQKGAELIAEIDKPPRVAAGIASLRAVSEGPDDQFGVQAMDIIADYIQQRHGNAFSDEVGKAAINALSLAHRKTKRLANRTLYFNFDHEPNHPDYNEPDEEVRFELVTGVFKAYYSGGYFDGIELTPAEVGTSTFQFHGVRLLEGYVDFFCADMTKCLIRDAAIVRFDPRRLYNNKLVKCDFSGCQVNSPHSFPDLRGGKNWFDKNRPPTSDMPDFDWSTRLLVGRPVEEEESGDDSIFFPPLS